MMRNTIILIAAIAILSCSKEEKGFKLRAEIEGVEKYLLLEKRGASGLIAVDTAESVDGVAVFEGKVDYPQDYYISLLGHRPRAIIFIENKEMTVTGKFDELVDAVVTGSKTHDEYKEVEKQMRILNDEYRDIYQRARETFATGDTVKANQMVEEARSVYNKIYESQKEFIRQNPGSYVSPYLLVMLQRLVDVEELEAMINGLDPKMNDTREIEVLKEHIAKLNLTAIGQKAPDFTMKNPDGEPITFSDIYSKNKITLLDFWAGWCGPCRQENPNVVAVYNDFKDQGFDVFGVSLDRTKDEWLNAIEQDNLTWHHVSDLSYWNNAAAKLYSVRSIPSSILVDSTGKIIAKDKRGNELRETVAQFLK